MGNLDMRIGIPSSGYVLSNTYFQLYLSFVAVKSTLVGIINFTFLIRISTRVIFKSKYFREGLIQKLTMFVNVSIKSSLVP